MTTANLEARANSGRKIPSPPELKYVPHRKFSDKDFAEEYSDMPESLSGVNFPDWVPPESLEELNSQNPGNGARNPLKPGQEADLFLHYNLLRYQYNQRRTTMQAKNAGALLLQIADVKEKIARANMGLVVAMAKRTQIPNVEFAEMISEGNMALLRSIEKFDVSRGFKFSTYACRSILKCFNRLATTTRKRHKMFPIEYDPDLEGFHSNRRLSSSHEEEKRINLEEMRAALSNGKAGLSYIEKRVLTERYRGNQDRVVTLAEVGAVVGLTNERVRQIEKKALGKLRDYLNPPAGEKACTHIKEKPRYSRRKVETEYGSTTEKEFILSSLFLDNIPPAQLRQELIKYYQHDREERDILRDYKRWEKELAQEN